MINTNALQKSDAAHHIHPFTDANQLKDKGARVITAAKGVYLTDSEGNEIFDAMAGLWCVNIGYGRDELADAAAQQMRELPYYNTFFQTTHPPAIALANTLASVTPDPLNHVFFAGSGSEANDTNIRMVRQYWANMGKPDKSVMISRHNAYHGSTVGAASLGGMAAMHKQGGLPIPNIHHIDQPYWYRESKGESPEEFGIERAQQLEKAILEMGENRVAAFIAEPIQGAGGVIIPPDSYWPEIQRICDQYEILLIADEVICGFGRTGNWFGSQTLNIRPDIMTLAKGLSSGYAPIAASVVTDTVAEGLASGGEFNHGYTYSAHPVCCAVASENIRILQDEGIIERVRKQTAPYLEERWRSLADHPMVGEARICGMVGALELIANKEKRTPFNATAGSVGLICRDRCFANNLVMRHVGDRMIISPPLIIDKGQIDTLVQLASKSLDEAYDIVRKQGYLNV